MKKHLKTMLVIAVSLLLAIVATFSLSLYNMQTRFDSDLYQNVVRLHILADSDSEYDQKAKLRIKDHVIEYITQLTEGAQNANEASSIICSNLSDIDKYVEKVSDELGYDYDITVNFSEEKYPVRYYEGFAFPAGKYRSLRISLGSGCGKNWWCVLYPSICVSPVDELREKLEVSGVSSETANYICDDKEYKISFWLLEFLGF